MFSFVPFTLCGPTQTLKGRAEAVVPILTFTLVHTYAHVHLAHCYSRTFAAQPKAPSRLVSEGLAKPSLQRRQKKRFNPVISMVGEAEEEEEEEEEQEEEQEQEQEGEQGHEQEAVGVLQANGVAQEEEQQPEAPVNNSNNSEMHAAVRSATMVHSKPPRPQLRRHNTTDHRCDNPVDDEANYSASFVVGDKGEIEVRTSYTHPGSQGSRAASMASQGDMPGFDADPVAVMQSLFATFVSANRSSSSSSACVDMHTHTRARASTRTHALLRLSDGGASSSGFTTCW